MCLNDGVISPRLPVLLLFVLLALPLAAQEEVGKVLASDVAVRGSVILASSGTTVMSGSQVTAGLGPARLQLTRGGFVRICPGTNLSVATSGGGLLLGMSSGALELHYPAGASTDTLVTPDFRIQLTGPGEFHYAVSVDKAGTTCIRPLGPDTAAAIITESFGSGSYQVSAGRSVIFHNGKIGMTSQPTEPCGCPEPEPPPPTELALDPEAHLPTSATAPPEPARPAQEAAPPNEAAINSPPSRHVEIEAPLVFHGDQTPDPFFQLIKLRARQEDGFLAQLQPSVVPPAARARKQSENGKPNDAGIFHRIGRFFRRIFGG